MSGTAWASGTYASRAEIESVSRTLGMLVKAVENVHAETVRLDRVQDRLVSRLMLTQALLCVTFVLITVLAVVVSR